MSSLTIYKDFNTETPRERKYNETNLISGDKEGLLGDKNVKEKLLAEVRNSSKYKREFEAGYDVNDTMDLFKLALKMDVIAVYKDLYVFNCNGVKGVSTDKEKHKGCNQFGYGFITKKEVDDLFGLKKISKKAKLMLEDKIDFEKYFKDFNFTFSEKEIFKKLYYRYVSLIWSDFDTYFEESNYLNKKLFLKGLEEFLEKFLVK